MIQTGGTASTTIVRLDEAPTAAVRAYLEARGYAPEYVAWKYFDDVFNAGRNRGFVALADGEVVGFIGLIPFRADVAGTRVDTAWTCDWSVEDAKAGPTAGLMLLKKATQAHAHVYHIGGNDITFRIYSRLAAYTDAEAACDYVLRLRLASQLDRLVARKPRYAPLSAVPGVGRIPIKRSALRGGEALAVEPGASAATLDALAAHRASGPVAPAYDGAYIDWQIGRCPGCSYMSCVGPDGAVGFLWQSRERPKQARIALFAGEGQGELVLRSLARAADSAGAESVRLRAASADAEMRTLLTGLGFEEKQSLPYFAFSTAPVPGPATTMASLSYLDVDEAGLDWL
ncbi:MAG: hypothetical protein AAF771_04320 [Pseudomonadota bacterium]